MAALAIALLGTIPGYAAAWPTDITLSSQTVDENQLSGTEVGTFTTTDTDPGDTHTYSLVTGGGDTDNTSFQISGNALQTNAIFDYETDSSYSIRVLTTETASPYYYFVKQFIITVTDVNEDPTDITLSDQTVDENQAIGTEVGTFTTTDDDTGDTHTYSLVAGDGATDNASFQISGNALQTSAIFDYETKDSYSIRVLTMDSGTGNLTYEKQFTITVTDINDAPLANVDSDTTPEDTPVTTNIVANDTDVDGTVVASTVAIVNGPSNGNVVNNGDGTVTYTPDADFNGSDTYTYTAQDNDGATSNEAEVTITVDSVNDVPSFTKGGNQTVNEDAGSQTVNGWATGMSAGPANESGQSLAFQVSNDDNALFAAQPAINATGDLTYTPANDANGSATVAVILRDNGGTANGGQDTSASQSFTITCNAVNDVPSFTKGGNQTVNEDAGSQTVNGWATGMSAGPANESGQSLAFQVSNDDNALFAAQPAINATTGDLTYTSADDANGSATVTVTLGDDGDTANGGQDTSASQTFTITCNAVNDAPVASDIPDRAITEGDAFTTVELDAYVSDVDNADAQMTWSYSGNSKLTVDITNRVATIGIPNADWYGSETITFRATDPGSLFDEDSATFTVGSANDPPVANDDSDTTPEDTPVTTNVVANDTDIDGTIVASTVAIVSGPSNGSVVNNGDGTVTYTPNANFNGSDSCTYTLRDSNGAPSNVATVTITVGPVNDTPIANDDTVLTNENNSILIEVTLNDDDPDGTIDPATIMIDHAPASGTVQVAGDGSITYSPNADFNGIDQFTYTVKDSKGATSNVAMVIVTVVEVNDPPIAEDDLATTKSGVPVSIAVLTNDNLVPGTVSTLSDPENGTATVNWDGTITYTSVEGFVGTDRFTYRVQDVHAATSNQATVTVEVLKVTGEGGNDLPVQESMPSAGFLKHDTDDISWLVLSEPEDNEGIYYILTVDSTVLEELALSADIQPTETHAGAPLEVGLELSEEDRKSRGWPWIRVTRPALVESADGGAAEIDSGYSFSGRCANGLYWLGIDTGDLPPGRYNFWIVYGEGKTLLVPILVLP